MGENTINKAAIFGASGVIGRLLTTQLVEAGSAVRTVARSEEHLQAHFGSLPVERHAADVHDTQAATRAADGCDVIFLCVGLPWSDVRQGEFGRAAAEAMKATGARGVLVSGYYSRTPATRQPIDDQSERPGLMPQTRARIEQEQAIEDAGGASAILPDFYGPGAGKSFLNSAIKDVACERHPRWLGGLDVEREFIDVRDGAALLIRLAKAEGAGGRSWIFPGSGVTSPRKAIAIAAQICGVDTAPASLTLEDARAMAQSDPGAQAMLDLHPVYDAPATFDASELRGLLGDIRMSAYKKGIGDTIEWIRSGGS